MLFLKKSVAIVCLIAFALSTTGISFQKHSCQMSGTTKVSLFPELFGHNISCCESASNAKPKSGSSIDKVPCCNNVFKFAKISSFFNNTFSSDKVLKIFANLPKLVLFQSSLSEVSFKFVFSDYRPPPLIHFGKTLLHLIQNLKIELPY